jgi:hypothetical protein
LGTPKGARTGTGQYNEAPFFRHRKCPFSALCGRLAHRGRPVVKLPREALDRSPMPDLTTTAPGFFARVGAALAALARYAGGCTLVNHPLPEVREVGDEWRLMNP